MTRSPIFGDVDFQQAMQRSLPRGRIWRADTGATLEMVLTALAPTYTRSAAASLALLTDIFPATTTNLLTEWEETLGLPDPCTPLNPTFEARRAAVLAKFTATGGQSIAYFTRIAAALGYAITVTEFTGSMALANTWTVTAPSISVSPFLFGGSFGQPFASWSTGELECRLNLLKPAHTTLLFNYAVSLIDDGGVLTLSDSTGWPLSAPGTAGAAWSNAGVVSIAPGATYNVLSAPIFFGHVTAAALLALNLGINLPTTSPASGTGQLWNSGNEVWIA